MKKLIHGYNKLEEYLLVYSLMFSVILIFVQVIMRSVFNMSLSWSEELARYIFIWQIWLGTSVALRDDKHINVELIFTFVKNKAVQKLITVIGMVLWLGFCVFLTVNGMELVQSMIKRNTLSSGMRIPLYWVYLVLPLSSAAVCVRLVGKIVQKFKERPDTDLPERGDE